MHGRASGDAGEWRVATTTNPIRKFLLTCISLSSNHVAMGLRDPSRSGTRPFFKRS